MQRNRIGQLLWLWPSLAILYFLWEFASYYGLFGWAAEWQLTHFGQYKPTLTFLLLALVFALPVLLLFLANRRSSREQVERPIPPVAVARRYIRISYLCSAVLAAAAFISLVLMLVLPRASAQPHKLVIGSAVAEAPPEGQATLSGQRKEGRVAIYTQNLLIAKYEVRFAPVFEPRRRGAAIRYFVELGADEKAWPGSGVTTASPRAGILVRDGLPGTIRRLYEILGYPISRPYYVLFASVHTMRLPYYVAGGEFAIAALAFLGLALFQRRRLKRISVANDEHGQVILQ